MERPNFNNILDHLEDVEVRRSDSPNRPYPGVRRARSRCLRWEAMYQGNSRWIYVGTFDTPEEARYAALLAQAEHLEMKAELYRAEALRVITSGDA